MSLSIPLFRCETKLSSCLPRALLEHTTGFIGITVSNLGTLACNLTCVAKAGT